MMQTEALTFTVFVNGHPVRLAATATVREAVRTYDRRLLKAFETSRAEIVDEYGWPVRLDRCAVADERYFICLLPWAHT